jgi:hypothetical protein
MLAVLLFLPAMAAGAEVPRLVVSTPTVDSPQPGLAVISPSERPVLTVVGTTADGCNPFFENPEVIDGDGTILLRGTSLVTILPCEDESWIRQFRLKPLPPGSYKVMAMIDETPYAAITLVVSQPQRQAVLLPGSGLFSVEVTYKDPESGEPTLAAVTSFSAEAATFWFFEPNNPEVTVKILDGRAVNGHSWVFVSSMTTMEFTVHVSRCSSVEGEDCISKDYHSPAGKGLDVMDLRTF